jgi:hypothetical protein
MHYPGLQARVDTVPGQLPVHTKDASLEVHVGPDQAERLPDTKPREGEEHEQRPVRARMVKEPRQVLALQDADPTRCPTRLLAGLQPSHGVVVLTLTIDESQDGYLSGAMPGAGLANAKPINVTLQSITIASGTYSCIANDTAYVTGDPDTAVAHCTIYDVAPDVYDVNAVTDATTGDNYFMGSGEGALVVYNPSLGFATGGAWYTDNSLNRVNFGFEAKTLKSGQNQGSVLLIVHAPEGNYTVKSNSMGRSASRRTPLEPSTRPRSRAKPRTRSRLLRGSSTATTASAAATRSPCTWRTARSRDLGTTGSGSRSRIRVE